jgi:hypothetical protein
MNSYSLSKVKGGWQLSNVPSWMMAKCYLRLKELEFEVTGAELGGQWKCSLTFKVPKSAVTNLNGMKKRLKAYHTNRAA